MAIVKTSTKKRWTLNNIPFLGTRMGPKTSVESMYGLFTFKKKQLENIGE